MLRQRKEILLIGDKIIVYFYDEPLGGLFKYEFGKYISERYLEIDIIYQNLQTFVLNYFDRHIGHVLENDFWTPPPPIHFVHDYSKIIFLKEIFLSPGHDRVVTIKSRNFFYCESLVLSGFLY